MGGSTSRGYDPVISGYLRHLGKGVTQDANEPKLRKGI
jgi:hypothetical protein